jgi:hypothetical protein
VTEDVGGFIWSEPLRLDTSEKLHKYISFYFRIFTYFGEVYYWIPLSDDGLDYRYSFSVRIEVTKLPEIGSRFEIVKN